MYKDPTGASLSLTTFVKRPRHTYSVPQKKALPRFLAHLEQHLLIFSHIEFNLVDGAILKCNLN